MLWNNRYIDKFEEAERQEARIVRRLLITILHFF
jgi:hypothetical protein